MNVLHSTGPIGRHLARIFQVAEYQSAVLDSLSVSIVHQSVALAVHKARDQANTVLNALEIQGHPETAQSASFYLALVSIEKRLIPVDPAPPALPAFVTNLERLVSQCTGKLAPIEPLIGDALLIARSKP